MEKAVVIFESPTFNAKEYEGVWNDLKAAGQEHPKGLISHVGFAKPEGGWMVVDVWESADAFNQFSKTLLPIIQKNATGEIPEPRFYSAHNVYEPQSETALA